MMKSLMLGSFATLLCTAAFAQNVQKSQNVQVAGANSGLMRLIDDSEGYVMIRDNVILIEGGSSIKVCNFGLKSEFFAAHAAGDAEKITANQPAVTCVPLGAFAVNDAGFVLDSPVSFYTEVDESEGYSPIAENIIMIEGESGINFCHFNLTDAFFAAAAANDTAAIADNQPSVTCVPLEAVDK